MRTGFRPSLSLVSVLLLVVGVAVWSVTTVARQNGMADGIIAGTVTSENGPEAGVWVIAETSELETKFAKIVVTDDRGQFVLPPIARRRVRRLGAWLRVGRFRESYPLSRRGGRGSAGCCGPDGT